MQILPTASGDKIEQTKKCSKCGAEKPLSAFHVDKTRKYGRYHMCKECRKKDNQDRYRNRSIEKIKEYWSNTSLYCHKRHGYIINVDKDYIYKLALKTDYCPICGCKLDWCSGNGCNDESPTLDRIYNEKILNEDNVWIICRKCNTTKLNRTFDEFVEYCSMVSMKFCK